MRLLQDDMGMAWHNRMKHITRMYTLSRCCSVAAVHAAPASALHDGSATQDLMAN